MPRSFGTGSAIFGEGPPRASDRFLQIYEGMYRSEIETLRRRVAALTAQVDSLTKEVKEARGESARWERLFGQASKKAVEAEKKRRAKNKAKSSNKVALRDRWLSSGFLGAVFGAPFGLLVGAVISLMTNNHGFMGFGAVIGAIVLGSIGLRGS
ncbi:MAG: hypothetical protein AAGE52_18505 [Myxococcota bacterium]